MLGAPRCRRTALWPPVMRTMLAAWLFLLPLLHPHLRQRPMPTHPQQRQTTQTTSCGSAARRSCMAPRSGSPSADRAAPLRRASSSSPHSTFTISKPTPLRPNTSNKSARGWGSFPPSPLLLTPTATLSSPSQICRHASLSSWARRRSSTAEAPTPSPQRSAARGAYPSTKEGLWTAVAQQHRLRPRRAATRRRGQRRAPRTPAAAAHRFL